MSCQHRDRKSLVHSDKTRNFPGHCSRSRSLIQQSPDTGIRGNNGKIPFCQNHVLKLAGHFEIVASRTGQICNIDKLGALIIIQRRSADNIPIGGGKAIAAKSLLQIFREPVKCFVSRTAEHSRKLKAKSPLAGIRPGFKQACFHQNVGAFGKTAPLHNLAGIARRGAGDLGPAIGHKPQLHGETLILFILQELKNILTSPS